MTTFNSLVLFAFAAVSITHIRQCHSKEPGPTVSITINCRLGMNITASLQFFNEYRILGRWQWFGLEYFKKYEGIVMAHFLGKDADVVPTVVAKSKDEVKKIKTSMVAAVIESFGGIDTPLNKPRILTLTPEDVRKWDKSNVLDPAAPAPVMYVYVDVDDGNVDWPIWNNKAAKFHAQGFDVVITVTDYVKTPTHSQCMSKFDTIRQYRLPGDTTVWVWEDLLKAVEKARTDCTKKSTEAECHFVSNGKCAVGIREPGNYCFYPECPQQTCNNVCAGATAHKEDKCSVTCGTGTKSKKPDSDTDPKLKHCPAEQLECQEAPCTGPTKKPSATTPLQSTEAEDEDEDDEDDEDEETTSGIGAPQKVPIWQFLLLWFGVVQAGRMWQWTEG